jgi:phage major head subunit gpT-like protein
MTNATRAGVFHALAVQQRFPVAPHSTVSPSPQNPAANVAATLQPQNAKASKMDITIDNVANLFTGFSAAYKKGFDAAPSHKDKIAMVTNSTNAEEIYSFLGGFPEMRKWLGDRHIKQLGSHGWSIKNELFESTVEVKRTHMEDDNIGHYGAMFEEVGRVSKSHPDELIFGHLAKGFSTECYDGQFFFDADHFNYHDEATGQDVIASNVQAGASPAWYLFDTTRMLKPMIWQERMPYKLTNLDRDGDHNVFFTDNYIYGVRARVNAGFGLWQLAYASKAELTVANYEAARAQMMTLRNDNGRRLGITPNVMIVPPELEKAGRSILKAAQNNSTSNVWHDSADLIVTPYLD